MSYFLESARLSIKYLIISVLSVLLVFVVQELIPGTEKQKAMQLLLFILLLVLWWASYKSINWFDKI